MLNPRRCSIGLSLCLAGLCHGQWNPAVGQWGRTDFRDVRVMAWNVRDAVCSTNTKAEGANNWCAVARIIASMKPDVLVMEECGDNSGNGSGGSADSQATLTTTLRLLIDGGADPFNGGVQVGAYVRKYDPALSYPYVYASGNSDGFNRNVIISKFPFADLNGDGRSTYDQFANSADLYAPGGGSGIRGWTVGELNLTASGYRGNLVIGASHLKSGGAASDFSDRLTAAQNIAYYIDYWYNGAGGTVPDPRGRIADFPQATRILDPYTPVIWGGDFNEDERDNGRDGPVLWMTRAQSTAGDGTDRDRTDCTYDDSRDPLNSSSANRNTQGSSKLDYLCYQDSIAVLRRSFVYNSVSGGPPAYPPEMIGYPTVALASTTASDHRPVIGDFILPLPDAPAAFSLVFPANGASGVPLAPTFDWSDSSAGVSYAFTLDDQTDFSSPIYSAATASSSLPLPPGLLVQGGTYYWRVVATNLGGSTPSSPSSASFSTQVPAPGAFVLTGPADGSVAVDLAPELTWTASAGAATYRVRIADNPGLASAFVQDGLTGQAFTVPDGVLASCASYWWTVDALNGGGTTAASNGPSGFATRFPADFNQDGFVDFFDYDQFVVCYEGGECPPGTDADFNGDGFSDFFDYDDFVVAYEQGC